MPLHYELCPSCQRTRRTLAIYTDNVKCHACGYYSRTHELLDTSTLPTAKHMNITLPNIFPFEWTSKDIPSTVLDMYGCGVTDDGLIVLPHYSPDMQLISYSTRRNGQRDFRMYGSNVPFGLHTLGNKSELIICEGQSDTLAGKTMIPHADVIGIPGSDTAKSLLPYMSYMRRYRKITVMVDNDEAGRKCRDTLVDMLPPAKTHIVTLDNGLDVGDYLTSNRIDDLVNLYKLAERVHNTTFMSRADCDKIVERGNAVVMPTGFTSLDKLLDGGLAVGDMTVLTGYTGRGKSAFIGNLAVNMAKDGVKVMYVAGEMSPDQTTLRLARQWNQTKAPIDKQEKREFLYPVVDNMLIDKSRDLTTAKVLDRIQCAVIDYDVRLVVIDVLSDIYSGDYKELNSTLAKLNSLAKGVFDENIPGCHILIVAHPKGDEDGPVDMNKLKGSSNIRQECCNVIAFNEVTPGSKTDTRRTLDILKAGRNSDAECGTVTVDYDKFSQIYHEVEHASTPQDNHEEGIRLQARRVISQGPSSPRIPSTGYVHVGTEAQAVSTGGATEDDKLITVHLANGTSEPVSPGLLLSTDAAVHRDEGDTTERGPIEVQSGSGDEPVNTVQVSSPVNEATEHSGVTDTTEVTQPSGTNERLDALRNMYTKHPDILNKHLSTTHKTNNLVRAQLIELGYQIT